MYRRHWFLALLAFSWAIGATARAEVSRPSASTVLKDLDSPRGIVLVVDDDAQFAAELVRASELLVYVQVPQREQVDRIRRTLDTAGLLNRRVYVEQGSGNHIHLADNLADAAVVCRASEEETFRKEILRVVRPGGKAWLNDQLVIKPAAAGIDEWSHPYHGPDNNPQSTDRRARAPYLTQFLAEPWYCPMPEVTVASGGRLFKAFGSRAFLRPQWPMLNTLIAVNGYNGTILWQRKLDPDFMIHRNTLVATPSTLYLADHVSCKLLDAVTGRQTDEIRVPDGISDGPVWKWMALEGGVLYALVGEKEPPGDALKGPVYRGAGWPWWKVPEYCWGFGRTLLAIDPATKRLLWHHRENEPLDSRAVCMRGGRIYFYSHRKYLGCLDAAGGKVLWKSDDAAVLEAIGEHYPAQYPATGFVTSAYVKCSDDALYFAGPTRTRLVAVSTRNGKLLWQYQRGAFQTLLREDGLYAMGGPSHKFDPLTGAVLAQLANRSGCTRATGSIDRIFVRGGGDGTFSWDVASKQLLPISPMRPPCHDGVVLAAGHLYWGPWMCGCNLSLIGNICLAPAGNFDFSQKATERQRLETSASSTTSPESLQATADDWPTYRKDNARSTQSPLTIADTMALKWTYTPAASLTPTAPVAAGRSILVGGSDGVVRALDDTGKPKWLYHTGGAIRVPPAISAGRALVGSADGWIYALDADSGRLLWRFRGAPVERKIAVHGTLQSTWPAASGVLVENGLAYAACGIANYDGTHVYALDAATGKIRWQNNTSGNTEGGQGVGASVQGDLLLSGGKLYLAGGNRIPLAAYDLTDGRFQSVRPAQVGMDRRGPRGHDLFVRTDGSVAVSSRLPLYTRPEDTHYLDYVELSTSAGVLVVTTNDLRLLPSGTRDPSQAKPVWSGHPAQENVAVAVASNAVILAGTSRELDDQVYAPKKEAHTLVALNLHDGTPLWRHALPAAPVGWGLAINREGQVVVSLRDGKVLCFGKK
jgi:outer membrane protein assembly factor BamB